MSRSSKSSTRNSFDRFGTEPLEELPEFKTPEPSPPLAKEFARELTPSSREKRLAFDYRRTPPASGPNLSCSARAHGAQCSNAKQSIGFSIRQGISTAGTLKVASTRPYARLQTPTTPSPKKSPHRRFAGSAPSHGPWFAPAAHLADTRQPDYISATAPSNKNPRASEVYERACTTPGPPKINL